MADAPWDHMSEMELKVPLLAAAFCFAWDALDSERVCSLFTRDGVFTDLTGHDHVGHAAIGAFVAETGRRFGRMRHVAAGSLVQPTSEASALHRSALLLVTWPEGVRSIATGEYRDEVVREDDGVWRFSHRTVTADPS